MDERDNRLWEDWEDKSGRRTQYEVVSEWGKE
jgi:hypothetical protein